MGILHLVGWSEEENRREYVEALFQICLGELSTELARSITRAEESE
jgi:hypothetical protein